mmetsp:Transcript_48906/g.72673  ORF Transcript_48906/g.72673 Transcript_48906/m.72673 type:complete len:209 (+) Transcript_48906:769-1395(+)
MAGMVGKVLPLSRSTPPASGRPSCPLISRSAFLTRTSETSPETLQKPSLIKLAVKSGMARMFSTCFCSICLCRRAAAWRALTRSRWRLKASPSASNTTASSLFAGTRTKFPLSSLLLIPRTTSEMTCPLLTGESVKGIWSHPKPSIALPPTALKCHRQAHSGCLSMLHTDTLSPTLNCRMFASRESAGSALILSVHSSSVPSIVQNTA